LKLRPKAGNRIPWDKRSACSPPCWPYVWRWSPSSRTARTQEVKDEATKKEQETRHTEEKALRYDLGEGMLEIGVVLASLYFISRKKLFPVISLLFGVLGIAVAITGALL
jgi:hypothetical protein